MTSEASKVSKLHQYFGFDSKLEEADHWKDLGYVVQFAQNITNQQVTYSHRDMEPARLMRFIVISQ